MKTTKSLLKKALTRTKETNDIKVNKFGVPLIPPNLHQTLFGNQQNINNIDEVLLKKAEDHLKKSKIPLLKENSQKVSYLKKLPKLDIFNDIESHFKQIGHEQVKPYLDAIHGSIENNSIPPLPSRFEFKTGWTHYDENGKATPVQHPNEDLLVFDIETCVQEGGQFPVMATAVSNQAWYSWCSPYLIDKSKKTPKDAKCLTKDDLISIGT